MAAMKAMRAMEAMKGMKASNIMKATKVAEEGAPATKKKAMKGSHLVETRSLVYDLGGNAKE